MKSIFLCLMISLSSVALAEAKPGVTFAQWQCNRTTNSRFYNMCLASTRQAEYYADSALYQCARINISDDLAKCIIGIRNKKYSTLEIQDCSRYNNGELLSKCLTVAGKTLQ